MKNHREKCMFTASQVIEAFQEGFAAALADESTLDEALQAWLRRLNLNAGLRADLHGPEIWIRGAPDPVRLAYRLRQRFENVEQRPEAIVVTAESAMAALVIRAEIDTMLAAE